MAQHIRPGNINAAVAGATVLDDPMVRNEALKGALREAELFLCGPERHEISGIDICA